MGPRPTIIEVEEEMHEMIGASEMGLIPRYHVHRRDDDVVTVLLTECLSSDEGFCSVLHVYRCSHTVHDVHPELLQAHLHHPLHQALSYPTSVSIWLDADQR